MTVAAKVKIELNRSAVRDLLRSPEMAGNLAGRGQAIARAAGAGHEVQTFIGRNRARVTVRTATTAARVAEAKSRRLTSAIDAGRS